MCLIGYTRSMCHATIFKIFTTSFLIEDWLTETMRLAEFKKFDNIFSKPESQSKSEFRSSPFQPQSSHSLYYPTLRCKWSGFCLIYSCNGSNYNSNKRFIKAQLVFEWINAMNLRQGFDNGWSMTRGRSGETIVHLGSWLLSRLGISGAEKGVRSTKMNSRWTPQFWAFSRAGEPLHSQCLPAQTSLPAPPSSCG